MNSCELAVQKIIESLPDLLFSRLQLTLFLEILFGYEKKKMFHHDNNKKLQWIAQRSGGISFTGNIQDSAWQGRG